jgi:hypothetical protein
MSRRKPKTQIELPTETLLDTRTGYIKILGTNDFRIYIHLQTWRKTNGNYHHCLVLTHTRPREETEVTRESHRKLMRKKLNKPLRIHSWNPNHVNIETWLLARKLFGYLYLVKELISSLRSA